MADSILKRLKDAIAGGDFENARSLIATLSEAINGELGALEEADRKALLERRLVEVKEALTVARAARAHIALRLNTVQGQLAYRAASDDRSWSVEG